MNYDLTLVEVLQSIVRDELRRLRFPEPAVVIEKPPEVTKNGENHYHCNVKLRRTGLELQDVPIVTGRKGEVALPGVGDLVLVEFLGGDVSAPIVTGRLYAEQDTVPEAKPGEFIYEQPDKQDSNLKRVFLKFPGGTTLTLTDKQVELVAGGTKVLVKHDGDVEIESKSKVTIKSSSDMALESGGKLALKARGDISLESQSGKAAIKAVAGASIKGGASAELQGATVSVKGQTSFSPA